MYYSAFLVVFLVVFFSSFTSSLASSFFVDFFVVFFSSEAFGSTVLIFAFSNIKAIAFSDFIRESIYRNIP